MELHIRKQSYDGYCVGTGIEFPGIVLSAKTDDELVEKFKKALPVHRKALERHAKDGVKDNITVISIDG